jgi:hypothetical protein
MQYEVQKFYLGPKFGTLIIGNGLQIFGLLQSSPLKKNLVLEIH